MTGACEGLKVLEVSRGMAGSLAGMVLADHGAEVIRIDKPGSEAIGPVWGLRMRDRGKKSVCLDLEQAEGRGLLLDLVKTADVAIVAMRRHTIERLGIDYGALAAVNPRLVYATITSFGWGWPDRKAYGYDAIMQARAGLLAEQTGFRKGPIHIAPPIASYSAGMFCVHGVLAALHTYRTTGMGQHVDINLLSSGLVYRGTNVFQTLEFQDVLAKRISSTTEPTGGMPMCNMNRCADGRWIALACQNRMFTERALEALDSTDLMADPRFRGIPRTFDRDQDRIAFIQAVQERIARFPLDEVVRRLRKHDVPGEPVLTTEEFARHPQIAANHMAVAIDDPVLGRTTQPGAVIKLSVTPSPVGRPAPLPGQDTREVLEGLTARRGQEIASGPRAPAEAAAQPGGPLRGVRVLDLCQYYAGPTAGRLLADMGAEVIKVELVTGDDYRLMKDTFSYANRGKRSIGLNLKAPAGREALLRLVETADIIFHNFRVGVPERLGLTYEEVSRRNPRIVYGWFTAFGREGEMRSRPSYESALCALSGVALDQSGEGNPPSYIAVADISGSLSLTAGMLVALHARHRLGKGQLVEGSLMGGMVMFAAPGFMQYPGKPPRRKADKGQHGMGPLYRLYEAREGWVFLACVREKHWEALRRALRDARLDGPDLSTRENREAHEGGLTNVLESVFRTRTAAEWESLLNGSDIPCAAVTPSQRAFWKSEIEQGREWTTILEHPVFGTVRQPGPHLQFSRTPIRLERPEPLLGQDTDALLAAVGYTADEIAGMRAKKVIS